MLIGAITGYTLAGPPGAAIGAVSALLPDLDTPESTLGKAVYPVSLAIKGLLGHRTLLHSIWPALLLAMLGPYGMLAGVCYATHLIADALTPEGICPLWPLPIRIAVPLVQTGGILENILNLVLVVMLGQAFFGGGGHGNIADFRY